jgi:ribosomal protein S18 acetylase RimI-like enzyme
MSDPAPRTAVGGSEELHFEEVGPEHAGALVVLFERNSILAITETFDPFPLTEAQARRIACEPRRDGYYLVARGEDLLGFSMLRGFDEGYEVPSFGVFVDHASQAQGVGRRLTAWTIERARLQGCPAVRLSVYADNTAARGIYDSLGFREQERQLVERRGRQEEKIVMRLELGG